MVGPLIDAEALARVRRYQVLARQEGEVRLQREDVPTGGWYAGPTVVVTDDPQARIVTDEIFGPVLVALRADDFDQALVLANGTPYALTAGVFSRSPSRIRRAATELRAGNVYINRAITGARVGRQPFGGYGLSGIGTKAGGPDYSAVRRAGRDGGHDPPGLYLSEHGHRLWRGSTREPTAPGRGRGATSEPARGRCPRTMRWSSGSSAAHCGALNSTGRPLA